MLAESQRKDGEKTFVWNCRAVGAGRDKTGQSLNKKPSSHCPITIDSRISRAFNVSSSNVTTPKDSCRFFVGSTRKKSLTVSMHWESERVSMNFFEGQEGSKSRITRLCKSSRSAMQLIFVGSSANTPARSSIIFIISRNS